MAKIAVLERPGKLWKLWETDESNLPRLGSWVRIPSPAPEILQPFQTNCMSRLMRSRVLIGFLAAHWQRCQPCRSNGPSNGNGLGSIRKLRGRAECSCEPAACSANSYIIYMVSLDEDRFRNN